MEPPLIPLTPGLDRAMLIGIQANSPLPLPGNNNRANPSGRASANSTVGTPPPDPDTLSQATPAPPVPGQGASAAVADLSPLPGTWIPQILSGPAGLIGRLRANQGTAALNASFIDATRDLAAALLAPAMTRPAQVISLADSATPSHPAAATTGLPDAQ